MFHPGMLTQATHDDRLLGLLDRPNPTRLCTIFAGSQHWVTYKTKPMNPPTFHCGVILCIHRPHQHALNPHRADVPRTALSKVPQSGSSSPPQRQARAAQRTRQHRNMLCWRHCMWRKQHQLLYEKHSFQFRCTPHIVCRCHYGCGDGVGVLEGRGGGRGNWGGGGGGFFVLSGGWECVCVGYYNFCSCVGRGP